MFVSSSVLYALACAGDLGVPMFFVISGYVITYSAESNLRSNASPASFLKSRFLRIYPTFWASVIVVLAIPYLIEAISSLKSGEYIPPSNTLSKYTVFEWVNILALTKVFFASSSNLQGEFNAINSVYWTLAIEFQFYCIVFIALCFKRYFRYMILAVSIAALYLLVTANPFNHGLFIHYWPQFSVGIALAYIQKNGCSVSNIFGSSFYRCLVFFLAVSCLFYSSQVDEFRPILFATSFGFFLWVISDFENTLLNAKHSNNLFFQWCIGRALILGSMSYSVYLLHGKLYQIPAMFARQIVDSDSLVFSVMTVIGTLFICYPFYYVVEQKFLSKRYKKIKQEIL